MSNYKKRHTAYSAEERVKLFEAWQSTGSITKACNGTGISRATFYYWHKRFEEGGFDALAEVRSHAPKNPSRINTELEELIITLKRDNPQWGKMRISKAIKGLHPQATMSPNTVRRVLIDANLWTSGPDITV